MKRFALALSTLCICLLCFACSTNTPTSSDERSEMPLVSGGGSSTANPVIAYQNEGWTSKGKTYNSLDVMDADGSHVTHLLQEQIPTTFQYPSWSNTGSKISYLSGNSIKRVDVAIVSGVPTAQNNTTLYSWSAADSFAVYSQAWSSSASEIAFSKRQLNSSVPQSQRTCKVMALSTNGGTPTEIYSEQGTDIRGICWSPDGSKVAFSSANLATGVRTVKVIDRSSGSVVFTLQLDSSVYWAWNMNWSRTGLNKLVFRGNASGSGVNKLYTLNLDEQNPTPTLVGTLSGDAPTSPCYAPDNSKIMYFNQTGTYSIKTITLSNNSTTTLLSAGGGLNLDWKR